jgi:hypothetical protein
MGGPRALLRFFVTGTPLGLRGLHQSCVLSKREAGSCCLTVVWQR